MAKSLKKIAKILISLGVFTLLTACGPHGPVRTSIAPLAEPQATGGKTRLMNPDTSEVIETRYISAGHKTTFARIEQTLGAQNDFVLANQIHGLEVSSLDSSRLFIRLKLTNQTQAVDFLAKPADSNYTLQRKKEQTQEPLGVRAECETEDCLKVSLYFKRFRKQADKTYKGGDKTAGVLYTKTSPRAELLKQTSDEEALPHSLREIDETLRRDAKIEQTSFSVVGAKSQAKIQILGRDGKSSLLAFSTPLVDTSEVAPLADQNSNVRLLGVDPDTNDMMIEVLDSGLPMVQGQALESRQRVTARSAVRFTLLNRYPENVRSWSDVLAPNQPEQKAPTPQDLIEEALDKVAQQEAAEQRAAEFAAQLTGGLFPTNKKNLAAYRQSQSFAKFGSDAVTKNLLGSAKAKVRAAIPNAPHVSELLREVFESLDMTTEFSYIMLIESNYLIDGKFNPSVITQAAKCGTAFGPWQIVNNTALAIQRLSKVGFKYVPIRGCGNKRAFSNEDDRGYLVQSTYMAAHYLKYLIRTYKLESEPIMAVVGYNQGDSGPANARQAFFRRFKNYNIDYRMVRKFNMAKTSYANQFLAYREVGQNTSRYGLAAVPKEALNSGIKRLSRSGAPTPQKSIEQKVQK